MQSGCHLGEFKEIIAVCRACEATAKQLQHDSEDAGRAGNTSVVLMAFALLFACTHSYGIFSFGLIFLVEGRGILQATLTLNGLVGGILLGLFSLGIFFKKANVKVRISDASKHSSCVNSNSIVGRFLWRTFSNCCRGCDWHHCTN